jgi:4-hydroxy-3-polyprenylbenzoate decarboxylase
MAFTKFIVVVDEHVNVHDEQDVLFHLFSNCDPARDTEIVHGPVDILDHASPNWAPAAKWASTRRSNCRPRARCGRGRRSWTMDAKTKELVNRRWKEYGL